MLKHVKILLSHSSYLELTYINENTYPVDIAIFNKITPQKFILYKDKPDVDYEDIQIPGFGISFRHKKKKLQVLQ